MKLTRRIASLLLAIFVFIGITAPAASASGRYLKNGIAFVNASSLRLRSSASTSSKTLDYANRNEVVVVLGKSGTSLPWSLAAMATAARKPDAVDST